MSDAKPQPPAEESKREESMQQQPSAPPAPPTPTGPPPTYNEAIGSSPHPPMPVPSSQAPYPTTAPYPLTDSSMPLPVSQPSVAPYPVEEGPVPIPMPTEVHSSRPMGFAHHTTTHSYQPIVNEPTGGYSEEYVHPKTYVVLQDERRRRADDDDCSCTDWMMCCWCCVESCRCLLLCAECAAACSK